MDPSVQHRLVSVRKLALALLCSALSVVLLHRYVFALYIVEGSSMSPTLNAGDHALVNMLVRRAGRIERGQIVLIDDGHEEYATKRIIGLPGEKLEIKEKRVFINGYLLAEPYLRRNTDTVSRCPEYQLGPKQYFVMGDNRGDSLDSRDYGPIWREAIIGSY